ncbi:MAG: hypothetical protein MZU97_04125 [Bacillus subtilis]|nr:hypothetical protein [Bacillus subtilis]
MFIIKGFEPLAINQGALISLLIMLFSIASVRADNARRQGRRDADMNRWIAPRNIGKAGGIALSILVYCFLYLPILIIFLISINASTRGYHWEGFHIEMVRRIVVQSFDAVERSNHLSRSDFQHRLGCDSIDGDRHSPRNRLCHRHPFSRPQTTTCR